MDVSGLAVDWRKPAESIDGKALEMILSGMYKFKFLVNDQKLYQPDLGNPLAFWRSRRRSVKAGLLYVLSNIITCAKCCA